MKTEHEKTVDSKNLNRFSNTDRDDATTAVTYQRKSDSKFADQDEPTWQAPDSPPAPRPADPIMNSSQSSSLNTITHNPA